jgi:hypothetical protein
VLGETVTLTDGGLGRVEVTATRAVDPRVEPTQQPRPDGRRRVVFRLHFESLAPEPLRLNPVTWAADERIGWMLPAVPSLEPVWLEPGEEADKFVAWDVSGNARLARLRVSLATSADLATAEWVIG